MLLGVALAGLSLTAPGCAEKELPVFDKPAIDEVRTLLVVPLQSPPESGAGAIASGIVASRLLWARYPNLTIVEAPVFYRLVAVPGGSPCDEDALRLGREMGADAVVTGSVAFAPDVPTEASPPRGMSKSLKDSKAYEDSVPRTGSASLDVRILSVKSSRPIYANSASAKGAAGAEIFAKACEAALEPLEKHLLKSRK